MPKHKTLKSVVASLAQSFTSCMNYVGDDYVMGHIVWAAWATGATRLRVDLLSGATDGSPLWVPEVRDAVAGYVKRLPTLVLGSSSSVDFVAAAELVVTVDPTTRRPAGEKGHQESPFTCTVRIVDDRGKEYVHEIRDWWLPEKVPPAPRKKPWWRRW